MQSGTNEVIWVFALALTLYAGWVDSLTRRIPNWLTIPALLLGIAVSGVTMGWHGVVLAVEGAGLALGLLLPLVFLRAFGAGDWKLMGAVGAFLGPQMLLRVLVASALAAGVMSIVWMIRARRVRETLQNLGTLVLGFLTFGFRPNHAVSLDNPDALKLPFGVAAAVGTLACFLAVQWAPAMLR